MNIKVMYNHRGAMVARRRPHIRYPDVQRAVLAIRRAGHANPTGAFANFVIVTPADANSHRSLYPMSDHNRHRADEATRSVSTTVSSC
jgi:hypothetical protein